MAKPALKSTLKVFPDSAGMHADRTIFQSHMKYTRLFQKKYSSVTAAAAECNCRKEDFFLFSP